MDFAEVQNVVTEETLKPRVAQAMTSVPCGKCRSTGPHKVDESPESFTATCAKCGTANVFPTADLVKLAEALRPKIPFVPPMD